MKLKLISLLCIISLFADAQKHSIVNAGFDFLLFRGKYENEYGEVNYNSKGGLFVEKSFQFPYIKNVFVNPGISFKIINEKVFGGGLGAGVSSSLNHYNLIGYLKIIHKPDFIRINPAVFYYGALTGTPIYTQANGSVYSYSVVDREDNWDDPDHKEAPSHLYKKIYYGILAGVEFSNNALVTPAFEVRFLPVFAKYHHHKLHPFELAINLKFGRKVNSLNIKTNDE